MSTNSGEPPIDDSDWISQAEAARIRNVTRQAIHKLVQGGQLRSLKIGGHILVSRQQVEKFSPGGAGRPRSSPDSLPPAIKRMLDGADRETRGQILAYLSSERAEHPMETKLGVSAEVILEALHRAGDLTVRMFRGVIAEASFEIHIVRKLDGWGEEAIVGSPPYDFLLRDDAGAIRVQVKLQRSQSGAPLQVPRSSKFLEPGMFIVETQRTRGGTDRSTGGKTRPYKFGEFDILAVAMQPSTGRWDRYFFTVGDWLIPSPQSPTELATYQPVPATPNEDWTDSFETCVSWLRDKTRKTIGGRLGPPGTGDSDPR